jgi:CIC family chloride channel protein
VLRKIFDELNNLIKLAQERLSRRQFMLLSSVLIGLSAGLAAIFLKISAHYVYDLATTDRLSAIRFWYLLLPLIGILVTVLVIRRLFKNHFVKGLSQVHEAINQRSGILPAARMYDQIVTSSLTVGMGGSTGLEAPIVITGAAFGSNYARNYHLSRKDRMLLLACGVAAGIAAAFNAPIAGVLFALEVLLMDITITAFTSLIIASANGALVAMIVLNENILLSFIITDKFNYWNVPFYVLLGVLAGLISVYHSRVFTGVEGLFHRRAGGVYRKAIIGGLLLTGLIALFPSLFGEGYQSIRYLSYKHPEKLFQNSVLQDLLSNELWVLGAVGLLIFVKSIATGLTIGAGGNGGNFAPSLFIGAYLGSFFSKAVNMLEFTKLPENNFTVVGMAGVLSGLYHAPLTAIFLIAEITGGYTLMIPLMIVSSISFIISRYFEPFSMDTKKMALQGTIISVDKDTTVLSSIRLADFIDADYPELKPDFTLGELVQVIATSTRNVFPVTISNGQLVGLVWLDDVRELMFKKEQYNTLKVEDLMVRPEFEVDISCSMHDLMEFFDSSGAWTLPVTREHKFVGFVTKSNVFTGYRSTLKQSSIE